MEQTEFTSQIAKHKETLRKYNIVSVIIRCSRISFFLLIIISLYFTYANSFSADMVAVTLMEITTLIALWLYHDKVRDKIRHSSEMIAINKAHSDRISEMITSYDFNKAEFVYLDCEDPCDPDIEVLCKDIDFDGRAEQSFAEYAAAYSERAQFDEKAEPVYAKASAIKFLLM